MPGILHVVTSDARRGAEVFAVELAAQLHRRGLPGHVVALRATGEAGQDVEVLGTGSGRTPATLRRLRAAMRSADLTIAHGSDTLFACAVSSLGSSADFVYRLIGDPAAWTASRARRIRVGAALRRAIAVVALTESAATVLADRYRMSRARIFVVPNAADASRFPIVDAAARASARRSLDLPTDRPIVAVVGALTPEKAPARAVSAAIDAGAFVVVAGDGPLRAALPVDDLRIRTLGSVHDIAPVYAAADAVVLASRTEGVPGVAIEAAMSGVPIVATNVGGTSEIVVDGVTGVLVDAADDAALRDAIARTVAHPTELDPVTARQFATDRFSLDVVASAWADLLRTILPR